MATGHILPGYGEPVSRLRRARSAGCYPLDNATLLDMQNAARLTQREFEQIRQNAKNSWLKSSPQQTTYDSFHSGGEIKELTQARPSSSHRHNNPHPSQVFLTNRLHYIEGYHNADVRLGKNLYKIDASTSKSEQERRRAPRTKYVARPSSVLVNQYKDPFGFRSHLPPRQAQAAEAWVKLADDADRDKVLDAIQEHGESTHLQEEDGENRPKSCIPSLHRWMKFTGVAEHDATSRVLKTIESDPLHQNSYYHSHSSVGQKVRDDIRSAGMFRFQPRPRRGEYSMHPDWPTSLPHHKVP